MGIMRFGAKCPECNYGYYNEEPFSENATACPQCGEPRPSKGWSFTDEEQSQETTSPAVDSTPKTDDDISDICGEGVDQETARNAIDDAYVSLCDLLLTESEDTRERYVVLQRAASIQNNMYLKVKGL